MSKAIVGGKCILRSREHCSWCQEAEHEAFRAQLGATLPCTANGPWVNGDGEVEKPVRRECGGCGKKE